jgi:peptidoglycan-associated lipoprotein
MINHTSSAMRVGIVSIVGLGLSGCVSTSDFEAHLQEYSALNSRVSALDGRVGSMGQAAQSAQARADAAYTLAEGKFLMQEVGREQVMFALGSSQLSDEAKATLTALADRLKSANKNVYLEVRGNTDSIGGKVSNRQLGRERAQNTARFLVDQGVPGNKLQVGSWGEDVPASQKGENNPDNRRVEIIILT